MFNILIDDCPGVLYISGQYLNIVTDFKSILKILSELEDKENEKAGEDALNAFYNETIPEDIETAVEAMEYFLLCGYEKEEVVEESNENDDEDAEEEKFYKEGYEEVEEMIAKLKEK